MILHNIFIFANFFNSTSFMHKHFKHFKMTCWCPTKVKWTSLWQSSNNVIALYGAHFLPNQVLLCTSSSLHETVVYSSIIFWLKWNFWLHYWPFSWEEKFGLPNMQWTCSAAYTHSCDLNDSEFSKHFLDAIGYVLMFDPFM